MDKSTIIEVTENKHGRCSIILPPSIVRKLLKMSGIRSRKKRHVHKAVKRIFFECLHETMDKYKA